MSDSLSLGAIVQSTFGKGTIQVPTGGLGAPPQGQTGAPTPAQSGATPLRGTVASPPAYNPIPLGQIQAGVYNLSEQSAGYETTIRGQPVTIAYPYS